MLELFDHLTSTLFAKTYAILSLQLMITWLSTMAGVWALHKHHTGRAVDAHGLEDEDEIDEHVLGAVLAWFKPLLFLDAALFFALLIYGIEHIEAGLAIFAAWSIVTGIELSVALVRVGPGVGAKIFGLAAAAIAFAGVLGTRQELNLAPMGPWLFGGLLLLLGATILRMFYTMSDATQRVMAGCGSLLFVLYLLFDFNHLEKASHKANDWHSAMAFSMEIYLDIINLILQLIDLTSKHH